MLKDRVCVVTGGAHGIGAATAQLFASHGALVVVADIDGEGAEQTAKGIAADGGRAEVAVADVRIGTDVDALRELVLGSYGHIDVLVNNVGHWIRQHAFENSDPEHWRELYEVNLWQVFRVTNAFLPSMLERGSGAIVNVSSNEGIRGFPPDPVYSAFKAAVVQFTKSLGVAVAGRGVRVNGIAPDVTATAQSNFPAWDPPEFADRWPMWVPIGRMGEPIDQARVLLFLASDAAGFLVGQTILTDGGTTAAGGWYPTSRHVARPEGAPPLPPGWTNRPKNP